MSFYWITGGALSMGVAGCHFDFLAGQSRPLQPEHFWEFREITCSICGITSQDSTPSGACFIPQYSYGNDEEEYNENGYGNTTYTSNFTQSWNEFYLGGGNPNVDGFFRIKYTGSVDYPYRIETEYTAIYPTGSLMVNGIPTPLYPGKLTYIMFVNPEYQRPTNTWDFVREGYTPEFWVKHSWTGSWKQLSSTDIDNGYPLWPDDIACVKNGVMVMNLGTYGDYYFGEAGPELWDMAIVISNDYSYGINLSNERPPV